MDAEQSATFSKPSRDVAIGQSVDEVAAIVEQNTHVCYSPSLSSLQTHFSWCCFAEL
jgi:hypothetical protein